MSCNTWCNSLKKERWRGKERGEERTGGGKERGWVGDEVLKKTFSLHHLLSCCFLFGPSTEEFQTLSLSVFDLSVLQEKSEMFLFPSIKENHFIFGSGREQGSLALSCAGLHRVRFAHFCSRPFESLTLKNFFFFLSFFFLQSIFWLFLENEK